MTNLLSTWKPLVGQDLWSSMGPVNQDEAADVLQYIRTGVRERGLADLDRLILESDPFRETDAVGRITAYLRVLRNQVRLGTEQTSRVLMSSFEGVRTRDGRALTGIQIDFTSDDAQVYGVDRIDVAGSPELDRWLTALEDLIGELEESRD